MNMDSVMQSLLTQVKSHLHILDIVTGVSDISLEDHLKVTGASDWITHEEERLQEDE